VQQAHPDGIDHLVGQVLVLVGERIVRCQRADVVLERSRHRRIGRRVPDQVERGRHVRVDVERCGVRSLRGEEPVKVHVDLSDVVRRAPCRAGHVRPLARGRDAVAPRVRRLAAGEVVALLDGEHEQRVVGGDAVGLQAVEERLERSVVVVQLLDVSRLARALSQMTDRVGRGIRRVQVVRVGDTHR
jgi:hypothetical protein